MSSSTTPTTPTTPRRKSGYQALLFMLISVVIAALISFIVWRMLTVYNERPPTWQEQAEAAGWVETCPEAEACQEHTEKSCNEDFPCNCTACPTCPKCKKCTTAAAAGASAPAVVAPMATPFDPAAIDYRPLPGSRQLVPKAPSPPPDPPPDDGDDTGT